MTKICYLLLCHKDPLATIEQIEYLLNAGGYVVVHMDKNAPSEFHKTLFDAFSSNEGVRFADPVRAGWGDWSLVNATLRMIDLALDNFTDATHFYYLSGDCVPIRSHEDLISDLSKQKLDIIETADFYNGGWIQTGPHNERIEFFHFLNERKHKWLFYRVYDLHRFFKIKRKAPLGITMSIGSQWWCLRRRTLERIRMFLRARPDIIKFFKWCWIPDEIFFQTMVATLVPEDQRKNKPPTFLRFSDYGLPTVFYNDQFNFLIAQEEYFARKISPNSKRLKRRLINRFIAPSSGDSVVSTGRNTIGFNIYAGRHGMRFGGRFWESGSHLPGDARIFVIVSKKWHVGKDFARRLSEVTSIRQFGYLLDEETDELGELGRFQYNRNKRLENPQAYMRMLLSTHNLNQAIFGADSMRFGDLKKMTESGGDIRVIELENQFSPEYLDGHAERAGLMIQHSSSVQRSALHQTIMETFRNEANQLKKLPFSQYVHIRDWHNARTRAEILGKVFEQEPEDFIEMARDADIRD